MQLCVKYALFIVMISMKAFKKMGTGQVKLFVLREQFTKKDCRRQLSLRKLVVSH